MKLCFHVAKRVELIHDLIAYINIEICTKPKRSVFPLLLPTDEVFKERPGSSRASISCPWIFADSILSLNSMARGIFRARLEVRFAPGLFDSGPNRRDGRHDFSIIYRRVVIVINPCHVSI